MSDREVVLAVCGVLSLHGAALPASLVGDELRRRRPGLWRRWRARPAGSQGGLLSLCAEQSWEPRLTVEGVEGDGRGQRHEPTLHYSGALVSLGSEEEDEGAAAAIAKDEAAAQASLVSALLAKVRAYPHGDAAPAFWLTMACERQIAHHVRLLPRFGGKEDRGGDGPQPALVPRKARAQMAKRLRAFVTSEGQSPLFSFEDVRCEFSSHQEGCCCQGRVRLTKLGAEEAVAAGEAAAAAAAAKQAASGPADLTAPDSRSSLRQGQGRMAWRRHAGTELPADAAGTLRALQAVAEAGSAGGAVGSVSCWILLVRSQGARCKDAQLMALELGVAAELHAVAVGCLAELAPGVWVVAGGVASGAASLVHAASRLASVRAVLKLHGPAAHEGASALAVEVPAALAGATTWSLEVELRECAVDATRLPFKPCPGAQLALEAAAAAAREAPEVRYHSEGSQAASSCGQHRALAVVEVNGGALLLCERVAGLCSVTEGPRPLGADACAAPWHRAWAGRPFQFSACLDSWVAAAVISMALLVRESLASEAPLQERVLDVCCGSGTLSAVAAASGRFASVRAIELDASFAARVSGNFSHAVCGAQVDVLVHDATTPFPDAVLRDPPGVVVSNPPWGWRLKAKAADAPGSLPEQDAAAEGPEVPVAHKIGLNILHSFPRAVVVLVCPEAPAAPAVEAAGFEVARRCSLGQSAVWVLAPTRRAQASGVVEKGASGASDVWGPGPQALPEADPRRDAGPGDVSRAPFRASSV